MWSPDDLDIRIIKAMASPHSFQWDVRITNANVAKGLSVDEETVRNRLRRMNEAGFLLGWQLVPNPGILDMDSYIVEVSVKDPGSKGTVISQICLLDNVTLVEDFYGDDLAVHLLHDDEGMMRRQIKLISSICGCTEPVWWKLGYPRSEIVPSRTEWLIIKSLRMNARGRLSDVARELDLSTRTVKRHIRDLIGGNAFYLDPLLDIKKVGGIRCRFWVLCDPDRKSSIDTTVLSDLSRVISTNTNTPEHSLYVVHCANASEVKEISKWLGGVKGVREVRSSIVIEQVNVQEWLAREIEKRL